LGIPAKIRVSSAVAQAARYESGLAVTALPRLRELLAAPEGELQVSLQAERRGAHAALTGSVAGSLPLNCERCGRRFAWPLQSEIDWRLVRSEDEERALLGECEPLLVENDELALREAIEDEVLLALPMLPRCETCENAVSALPPAAPEPMDDTPRRAENPFAALKKQLKSD
jgi:uncharacterized protein